MTCVFGIPGVHTVELYRGLAGSPIRHITARHEQGCAFMADGYARASGTVGVAFVITGPGLLNALTAMAQARADSVPMLVISGVNRRDSLGKGLGLLHELPNQSALIAALCPTRSVMSPEDLAPALDWAFRAMTEGRPTPVHLEIPTDVMPLPCPPLPAPAAQRPRPAPSRDEAARAAALLTTAQHPVILAGGGVRGCEAALRDLAEALDAPVIQTVNARGLMHGHALTVPASASLDSVRALIAGADGVLALGTELGQTDYDMYVRGGMPDLSHMIRVDIDAGQLSRHPAALHICADTGAFLSALAPLIAAKGAGTGAARAAQTRSNARIELARLDAAMPQRLAMIEAIRRAMPRAQIIGDSTQTIYAANLFYDHDLPSGWFNAATGFGALGYGAGAAIGAALARTDVATICIIGDGGLQFTAAELRTALDEALPITFIIWNNAAYGEIADAMRAAGTEVIGCHPSPLDHAAFANAAGLPFVSIAADEDLLTWALTQPQTGPRIIELRAA
ncbi:MAG: 5-guanidino-2-oxopentanoate decarboxylase [Cypionkella sp.]|nr:5-guanidino-2-oxopentanoate decarboxylase [Cypionkella sp.]